jgi:O-antigen/teichoic acid export membrane protein
MKSYSRTFKTLLLTVAKMMALVASIGMAAALSRLLGKAEYGAFRQVVMLYAISNVVFRTGVPQSIFYFLPRLKEDEQAGFLVQSIGTLLLQGGIIGLALYVGADALGASWHSEDLPDLLRAFAIYPALMLPAMAAENVLVVQNRVYTVVAFDVLTKIASVGVVVGAVMISKSVIVAIQAWGVFAGVELAVAIWLIVGPMRTKKIRMSWRQIVDQQAYTAPYMIAAVLGATGYYADKCVVSWLRGAESFAIYANGAFELPFSGVLSGAVTMAILPSMVEYAKCGEKGLFLALWRRAQTKVAMVLFPCFGFFLCFAPEAVVLLFSKRYVESIDIFRVYLFLVPVRICSFNVLMVPLRQNWMYALGHLLQLLLAYPACLVLCQKLGLAGAALGLVIAVYANVLFLGFASSRVLGLQTHQMWPVARLAGNLGLAFGAGVVALLVVYLVPSSDTLHKIIRLVTGGLTYAVTYLLLIWWLGWVRLQDWRSWLLMFGGGARRGGAVLASEAAADQQGEMMRT